MIFYYVFGTIIVAVGVILAGVIFEAWRNFDIRRQRRMIAQGKTARTTIRSSDQMFPTLSFGIGLFAGGVVVYSAFLVVLSIMEILIVAGFWMTRIIAANRRGD